MTFETSILEFTLKQCVYVHVLSSSFQKSVIFIPRKSRGGIFCYIEKWFLMDTSFL
jgi:hypothetical protein